MAPYGSAQAPSIGAESSPTGSSSTPHQHAQSQPPHQPNQAAQLASAHKRVYQACIPCRRRKVRCDLGSVDNPHDPPCVRCRRESKECFFSATRRKRKTDDGDGSDVDEYIVRNGRKRVQTSGSPPPFIDRRVYNNVPLTPGGSHGRHQPLRRPDGSRRDTDSEFGGVDGDANQTLENFEAQTVMRRSVFGPHDALDLLYKAATDSPVTNHHERKDSMVSTKPPPPPSLAHDGVPTHIRRASRPVRMEQPIDPELGQPELSSQPGYIEAIAAWQRFRFVRWVVHCRRSH